MRLGLTINAAWARIILSYRSGPVAQLGARFHGMEEVVGSNPTRSTKSPNNLDWASLYNRDVRVVTPEPAVLVLPAFSYSR